MSIRLSLAAVAVLALATPALAQQAPVAPVAPSAGPVAPAAPTPEQQAAVTRIEAAGEAMDPVMEALEARASVVREDASLSAAEKETRIRAMIAEHQPVFDEFGAALIHIMTLKAIAEGASAEEAANAGQMVGGMMINAITQGLLTGEAPEGMGGE